jgi:hypothetical protein
LAKQILSGFGIKVSILPQTIAGFPVGITWPIPQKQLNIIAATSVSLEAEI